VAASLGGVYLSFFLDSAPAPTIVLLLAAGFVLALLASARGPERVAQQAPRLPGP